MDDRPAHSRAVNSAVQGRIWLKFELIQTVMVILVTSKNEEDPIKIEGARVAIIFLEVTRISVTSQMS